MNRILAAAAVFALATAPAFADSLNTNTNANVTVSPGIAAAPIDGSLSSQSSANPQVGGSAHVGTDVKSNANEEGGGVQNPKIGTGVNGAVGTGINVAPQQR